MISCQDWLSKLFFSDAIKSNISVIESHETKTNRGRPNLEYNGKKTHARVIVIANLANSYDLELLVLAAAYKARQEHKNDLRFLLVQSIQNPQNFFDIRNSYLKFLNGDKVTKMSNDVALGLILNANISKDSYQQIRDVSRKKNADIFPTYNEVRYSKKNVIPKGFE